MNLKEKIEKAIKEGNHLLLNPITEHQMYSEIASQSVENRIEAQNTIDNIPSHVRYHASKGEKLAVIHHDWSTNNGVPKNYKITPDGSLVFTDGVGAIIVHHLLIEGLCVETRLRENGKKSWAEIVLRWE